VAAVSGCAPGPRVRWQRRVRWPGGGVHRRRRIGLL